MPWTVLGLLQTALKSLLHNFTDQTEGNSVSELLQRKEGGKRQENELLKQLRWERGKQVGTTRNN